MSRPIRWLLRISIAVFIVAVAAVVALVLERDNIIRHLLMNRMRAVTGMGVTINSVHVGFRSHTFMIQGLKLFNTPEFGGALCLDMPELYVKFDTDAAHPGSFHLPLVRLNLARIDVVTDKHGRSNFDIVGKQKYHSSLTLDNLSPSNSDTPGGQTNKSGLATNRFAASSSVAAPPVIQRSPLQANSLTQLPFDGIDTLDLSLGKYHASNLRSGTEVEVDFNMTNQVFHNVKSEADLTGVAVILAMRSSSSTASSGFDLAALLNNLISP